MAEAIEVLGSGDVFLPWVMAFPHDRADCIARFVALDFVEGEWWAARGLLADSGSRGVIVRSLTIEPWPRGSDREVTGRVLRSLRIGSIRDKALESLAWAPVTLRVAERTYGDVSAEEKEAAARAAKSVARGAGRPGGRRGYPDDHYRRIALSYLDVYKTHPRDVVAELARREGRPSATVRDWVHRARELGYLSPTKQGRGGGSPGPRLKEEGSS